MFFQVNLLIPLHLKDNKTQSPKWKINLKSLSLTNQSQNASGEPVLMQSEYLPVPPHCSLLQQPSAVATVWKQKVQLS